MASSINKSTTTNVTRPPLHLVLAVYWIFQSTAPTERTHYAQSHTPNVLFVRRALFPKVNKPLSIWNHLLGKFSNPLASRYAAPEIPLNGLNQINTKNKIMSLRSCAYTITIAHSVCYSRQVWLIKHFFRYRHSAQCARHTSPNLVQCCRW